MIDHILRDVSRSEILMELKGTTTELIITQIKLKLFFNLLLIVYYIFLNL